MFCKEPCESYRVGEGECATMFEKLILERVTKNVSTLFIQTSVFLKGCIMSLNHMLK